ncbi:MAG TPA: TetR/AcrR family transcriptional regulator [Limnobacter sp.]|nr:TetR/AcrR family transcriptional regulator [Limnobacter sp.]
MHSIGASNSATIEYMKSKATKMRHHGHRSYKTEADSTKKRLIGAGTALFSSRGFKTTTVAQLCKAAGCKKTSFFDLFNNKLALLELIHDEIVAEAYTQVSNSLMAFTLENQDLAVRCAVDAFLNTYLEDPRRAKIACIEIVGVHPRLERQRHQNIKLFAQLFAGYANRLRTQGAMATNDFEKTGLMLAGGLNTIIIDWLNHPNPVSIGQLSQEFDRLIQACLLGDQMLQSQS